jgi:hypothetical protein
MYAERGVSAYKHAPSRGRYDDASNLRARSDRLTPA